MASAQAVSSAAPETLGMPSRQVAHNLAQLILAQEAQHRQPIVSLRDALLQLRLLDQPRLNALAMESPDLLRSRSSERVQRLLLTEDELHQALACVAGSAGIHIESNPGEALTVIRFRRDGDLAPCLRLPAKLRAPLVSRIKIMARLDIAKRRRPQDGKIDFSEFGGKALELRVAIMPTQAGFSERTFGLVLAAGPTGSGKTTTLHAKLAELNTAECKIWTAEDPIDITQPGHLALSTLHTNNPSDGVVRLLKAAGAEASTDLHTRINTRHAVGYDHCGGKGDKGRLGVYEILQNSRAIRLLIQNRALPSEIFDAALSEGMRSLRHDAIEKVVQGLIDLKQARTAYR
ncbi:MAG: ATPase, T2SS/T4P/T4SS family [Hydrogenophaga sp.]|nr:ATPase, T2SS/T4P/T4SS family [Hydrogenophaga sp.]